MAHYAILNNENMVVTVISGPNEWETTPNGEPSWENYFENLYKLKCKRTSYNTREGVYFNPMTAEVDEDQTLAFRKNYAGFGMYYNEELDGFIVGEQAFPSWVIDEFRGIWRPPTNPPDDGKPYYWKNDEEGWVVSEEELDYYTTLSDEEKEDYTFSHTYFSL